MEKSVEAARCGHAAPATRQLAGIRVLNCSSLPLAQACISRLRRLGAEDCSIWYSPQHLPRSGFHGVLEPASRIADEALLQLRKLIRSIDVIIESPVGGLDAPVLHTLNPRLVQVSVAVPAAATVPGVCRPRTGAPDIESAVCDSTVEKLVSLVLAHLAMGRGARIRAILKSADADALGLRSLSGSWVTLTPREWTIFRLMAEGLANVDIAARLGVSIHTIRSRLRDLHGKLETGTRLRLAMLAAASLPTWTFSVDTGSDNVSVDEPRDRVVAASGDGPVVVRNLLGWTTHLTAREATIFRHIGEGRSNREIAHHESLALSTVRSRVSRLYGKLETTSRLKVAMMASRVKDGATGTAVEPA